MSAPVPAGEETATVTAARPLPFDALHRDVLALVAEVRAYAVGEAARPEPDPVRRLAAAGETGRLVARLGLCLTRVLASRAVRAGELAPEAARELATRLAAEEQGVDRLPPGPVEPPARLGELVERADRLRARIERLDPVPAA